MNDGPARPLLARRIGIHGVRSAGKTCYLGSLYGFRATELATVDFADDATCHYLAAVWKDLSEGRVPGATLLAMPTHLRMDLQLTDDESSADPLLLCDYAGLLVEPKEEAASPAAHALAAGVREWFRSCHAVLVFLDCSRPDLDQLDALDLLLTELRRPGPEGPTLERPLAIVLTKWDTQGPISGDFTREQARARDFLRTAHAFRQIGQKLDANLIKVFPVSAFGNHARGLQPPDLPRYAPCHLHAPLIWASEVSDLVLMEEARELADRHLNRGWHVFGLTVWPQPDHAAARQTWLELKASATPGHGPLAEQIDEEIATLGSRHRSYWLGTLATLAAVFALIVLGLNHAARAADRQAEEVLAYCRSCQGPEAAGERLARADEFLACWSSRLIPHRREEVAQQRDADAHILAEQADRPRALEEFAALHNKEQWEQACELVLDFLNRYPSSPICEQLGPQWNTVREEGNRLKTLARLARLEEQLDFDAAIATCDAYLRDHPQSRHVSEFVVRSRELKNYQADRAEYEEIRRFARKGEPDALEEAARLAGQYLKARQAKCAMRPEVERYWEWFRHLQQGGNHEVLVESVSIPRNSVMVPVVGQTVLEVHVTINGKTYRTGRLSGPHVSPDARLGPFPFQWGKSGSLVVRVSSKLYLRTAEAEVSAEDPVFVLAKANGALLARDENGKEVRVVLRCPSAVPPDLPTYRRR